MPFLGKQPTAGFASIVKDDLTPNGSTTAFTLSKQVANANDIAVFLGNVRQEPTDAYTVSGTTLTMSEAPASGLNFYVLHIAGTLESSVVPADNTISTAKIQNNAISMSKLATSGTLPALDGSALTGVDSITQADTWQNNANFTQSSGNNVDITTMARNASDSFGGIGTGLSHSSGVFTFPETGIYFINAFMTAEPQSNGVSGNLIIRETINGGSSYSSLALTSMANMNTNHGYNWSCNGLMDVTDTTQVKFKLATYFSANSTVMGNANYTITGVTVVRLGDT